MKDRSNLLTLPNEVLLQILEYVDDQMPRPYYQNGVRSSAAPASPFLALNLVSRRSHAIAEPQLYKRLNLCRPYAKSDRVVYHCLLDALQQKPQRPTFVQYVLLAPDCCGIGETDYITHVSTVLNKFVNLTKLWTMNGEDVVANQRLFKAVEDKRLQVLSINSVVVEEVTKPGILLDLKDLRIRYVTTSLDPDRQSWWQRYDLPQASRGISPLESLTIARQTGEGAHPCTFIPILLWAKALQHLRIFFALRVKPRMEDFTTSQLQQIIDIHSKTLHSIILHPWTFYNEDPTIPDFQHFICLQELQLSWMVLFNTSPEEAVLKLVVSRLRVLTIDFDWAYPDDTICEPFDDTHLSWFDRFSTAYGNLAADRRSLKRIHLVDVKGGDSEERKRLRATRATLKRYQIDFEYSRSYEYAKIVD